MSGLQYHAEVWPWQFFVTLTFHDPVPGQGAKARMLFAWLRKVADGAEYVPSTHFRRLGFLVRGELGEVGGRHHYHLLLSGLHPSRVNRSECFFQMNLWEALGGGFARVRTYDARHSGAGYVLKGLEQRPVNAGANAYEVGKFDDTRVAGRELILAHHLLGLWAGGATCKGLRSARRFVSKAAQRDRQSASGPRKAWGPKTFPHPADSAGARLHV